MSSSSEVVVVDILSFLGSGSGSCCGGGGGGGGGELVIFESGLSIFSGLCGVWTRWLSMYPLRFFFFFFLVSRFLFHTCFYTLIKP